MTHRWGFDLSTTAVRLMRREAGHWHEVASESMTSDRLNERLKALAERVPEPRVVDIFLPSDQILYTDVKLTDPDNALPDIEAAMQGRTPYALSELEIDWQANDEGIARVAAIAHVTLEEAEAFAEQCGARVARFSALANAEDFPQLPDFGTGKAADHDANETDLPAEDAAPSGSDPTEPTNTESDRDAEAFKTAPVVQVDDAAPVVAADEGASPPLDPGPALPRTPSTPRVRTDVSLPEGGGRAAASLTPPAPVDPYGKTEPDPERRKKGLVAGLAAILTAGLAIVIWSILPDSTDTGATSIEPVATPPVAETPPKLSDVPPTVIAELPLRTVIPTPSTSPEGPVATAPPSKQLSAATLLPDVEVFASPLPVLPAALGPRPAAADAVLTELASSSPGPDTPALDFETPSPPVTRPGNVALPGEQSFTAGLAPTAEEAPEYVMPVAPVVAALPEIDEDATQDLALPTDDDAISDTVASAPDPAASDTTERQEPETVDLPRTEAIELPASTELAASIPEVRSRARPRSIPDEPELPSIGGRTRSELAELRPPPRPQSAQGVAEAERSNTPPSSLAVAEAPPPRSRPATMERIVANARAAERARQLAALPRANTSNAVRAALESDEDDEATSARNSPRLAIPSNTSVARQATVDDGISLNRVNLVGVFGLPSDRRALVRLPSGRYVKVKIGDKVDGGTVAAITDSALQYRKGGRTIQLDMPQG